MTDITSMIALCPAAADREALLAASKAALERMEEGRRVFLRGRALALAQRFALYARDELAMSTMRIRVLPFLHVSLDTLVDLHVQSTRLGGQFR